MDNFFPEDYKEVPAGDSNYMQFEDGDNRFRILDKAIFGWEDWDDNKKVYRYPMNQKPAKTQSKKPGARVKHFWAVPVWNYKRDQIQILTITQATVQRAIKSLIDDPDWGDPIKYDILVKRSGNGIDTEYQVNPKPHAEIPAEILEMYKNKNINLAAMFGGGDPFKNPNETAQVTPAEEAKEESGIDPATVSQPDGSEDVNPDDIPF